MSKALSVAKIFVQSTPNNTIITLTDLLGNVMFQNSSGRAGFKGAKKSTPYAAKVAADNLCNEAKTIGIRDALVVVKGPGSGKDAVLRALQANGINVISIADVTEVPHGGTRRKKRRKV